MLGRAGDATWSQCTAQHSTAHSTQSGPIAGLTIGHSECTAGSATGAGDATWLREDQRPPSSAATTGVGRGGATGAGRKRMSGAAAALPTVGEEEVVEALLHDVVREREVGAAGEGGG
eukprot:COSAG01_NODE_511_length_16061_cov_15.815875_21_plen_118_part_00